MGPSPLLLGLIILGTFGYIINQDFQDFQRRDQEGFRDLEDEDDNLYRQKSTPQSYDQSADNTPAQCDKLNTAQKRAQCFADQSGARGNENPAFGQNFQSSSAQQLYTRPGSDELQDRTGSNQNTVQIGPFLTSQVSVPKYCFLPSYTGQCRAAFPRYFYDSKDNTCKPFIYGGCNSNGNNFQTMDACENTCKRVVCGRIKQVGSCLGYFPKYYYDINTQRCKRFIYGGCLSNGNNFNTKKDCYSLCRGVVPDASNNPEPEPTPDEPVSDIDVPGYCHLPAHTGPCRALFMRYHYDPTTFECKSFTYGGCQSNGNNFEDVETCQRTCKREVCDRPKFSGMCEAYMPRFYYDINSGYCREFIYGGCQSNGNNFLDVYTCENVCAGVTPDNPYDPDPQDKSDRDRVPKIEDDRSNDRDNENTQDNDEKTENDDNEDNDDNNNNNNDNREEKDDDNSEDRENDNREDNGRFNYDRGQQQGRGRSNAIPKSPAVCQLGAFTGPCRAYIPRWYFNSRTGNCETFIYGGCQSNGNNFKTEEECEAICESGTRASSRKKRSPRKLNTCQNNPESPACQLIDRIKSEFSVNPDGQSDRHNPQYEPELTSQNNNNELSKEDNEFENRNSNPKQPNVQERYQQSYNSQQRDDDDENSYQPNSEKIFRQNQQKYQYEQNANSNRNEDNDYSRDESGERFTDDEPNCAKTCDGSHKKFNIKKGKIYKYKYEAEIDTSISDQSADSRRNQAISGHRIQADVEIRVIADCEMELKVKNAHISGKKRSSGNDRDDDSDNKQIEEELLRHPLLFSFQDGRIDDICGQREENPIVIDIKKGILTMMQNTMKDFDRREVVYESDMSGTCPTIYEIDRSDNGLTIISKTKDLSKCMQKRYHEDSIGYAPTITDSAQRTVSLLNGKKDCRQKISREQILDRADCKEKFVFSSPQNKRDYQPSFSVETRQSLKFVGTHPHAQDQYNYDLSQQPRSYDYVRSRLLSDSRLANRNKANRDGNSEEVLEHLQRMAEDNKKGVRLDAPQAFIQLVDLVRSLPKESIIQIYHKLRQGQNSDSDSDTTSTSYKFFVDAVPMAATLEAVEAMVEIINGNDLSRAHTRYWILSCAFISEPELEMVEAMEPLLNRFESYPEVAMAISSLIHNLAKARPHYQDLGQIPIARKVQNFIAQSLHSCNGASDDVQNNKLTLQALKALGNMGYSPSMIPNVLACFQNQYAPREIKSAAVDALRRMPCQAHHDLMELFQNGNDVEVRVKAFFLLNKCPSQQSLKLMRQTLQNEANKEVLTVAYTFYRNLEDSSDPHKQKLKFMAEEEGILEAISEQAMKYINRNNAGQDREQDQSENEQDYYYRVGSNTASSPISRHFESSIYSDMLDTGLVSEGHILYDRAIPRSAVYNLTLDLFGLNFNLFEAALQLEMTDYLPQQQSSQNYEQNEERRRPYLNLLQQSSSSSSQSQNNQQNRKRSLLQQQASYNQDENEEQEHIFKAFDEYANGDYTDFSNLASGLIQFISDPRFESLRALSSLKIQGNEIAFFDIFGKDIKETLANPFVLLQKLAQLTKSQQTSITESTLLFDSTTMIPTSVGIPVNVTIRSGLVSNVELNGKMDFSKMLTSHHQVTLIGKIQPSAAIKTHVSLSLTGVSQSGVGISSTFHTNTELSGEINFGLETGLRAKIDLPEKQEIFTTWNEFFYITNTGEKMLDEHGVKKSICSGDKVAKMFGIETCLETVHPSMSTLSSPKNIPTGIMAAKITLEKSDSSIKEYNIKFDASKEAESEFSLKATLDTPGASTDRHLEAHGKVNVEQKSLNLVIQAPDLHWEVEGNLRDESMYKTSASLVAKTEKNEVHKYLGSYESRYEPKSGQRSRFWTYDYIDPQRKNTYAKLNMTYSAAPSINDIEQQSAQNARQQESEKKVMTYWAQVYIPDGFKAKVDGVTSYNHKSYDLKFKADYSLENRENHRLNVKKYIYYERVNVDHTFKYVSVVESTQVPSWNHDISIYSTLKTNDERGTLKKGIRLADLSAHIFMNEKSWFNGTFSVNNEKSEQSRMNIKVEADSSTGRKVSGAGTIFTDLSDSRSEAKKAELNMDISYDQRRDPNKRIKLYFGLDKESNLEIKSDGQIDIYPKRDDRSSAKGSSSDESLYARYVLSYKSPSEINALIDYDLGEGKQFYNLLIEYPAQGDKTHNLTLLLVQRTSENDQDHNPDLNRISATVFIDDYTSQAKLDVDLRGKNEETKMSLRHKKWSRPNDQGLSTSLTMTSPWWATKNVDMLLNLTAVNSKVEGRMKLTHNEHKLLANVDGTYIEGKSVNIHVSAESSFSEAKSISVQVKGEKANSKWDQNYDISWQTQTNIERQMSLHLNLQVEPRFEISVQVHSTTVKNLAVDIRVNVDENLNVWINGNWHGNKIYIKTIYPLATQSRYQDFESNSYQQQNQRKNYQQSQRQNYQQSQGKNYHQSQQQMYYSPNQESAIRDIAGIELPLEFETNIKFIANQYVLDYGFVFSNLVQGVTLNINMLISPLMKRKVELRLDFNKGTIMTGDLQIQLSKRVFKAQLRHEPKDIGENGEHYETVIEVQPDAENKPQRTLSIKSETTSKEVAPRTDASGNMHTHYEIITSVVDSTWKQPWRVESQLELNGENELVELNSVFKYRANKNFGVQFNIEDKSRLHLTNITWLFRIFKTDVKLDWRVEGHLANKPSGYLDFRTASSYLMDDGNRRSVDIKYTIDPDTGVQVSSIEILNTDLSFQVFVNTKRPSYMVIVQIGDPKKSKESASIINLNTDTLAFNIKYREKLYARAMIDSDTKASLEVYLIEPKMARGLHFEQSSDKPDAKDLPAIKGAAILNDSRHISVQLKWDSKLLKVIEEIVDDFQKDAGGLAATGWKHLLNDIKNKLDINPSDRNTGLQSYYRKFKQQLNKYSDSAYDYEYDDEISQNNQQPNRASHYKQNYRQQSRLRQSQSPQWSQNQESLSEELDNFMSDMMAEMVLIKRHLKRVLASSTTFRYKLNYICNSVANKLRRWARKINGVRDIPNNLRYKLKRLLLASSNNNQNSNSNSLNLLNLLSSSSQSQSTSSSSNSWSQNLASQSLALIGLKQRDEDDDEQRQQSEKQYFNIKQRLNYDVSRAMKYLRYVISPQSPLSPFSYLFPKLAVSDSNTGEAYYEISLPFRWTSFKQAPDTKDITGWKTLGNIVTQVLEKIGIKRRSNVYINFPDALDEAEHFAALINSSHVLTWDKQMYPLNPFTCKYILAQDMKDKSWSIAAWHTQDGSLIVEATLRGKRIIKLGPGHQVKIDNSNVRLPVINNDYEVLKYPNEVIIHSQEGLLLKFQPDSNSVLLALEDTCGDKVAGLFGTNDDNRDNEFMNPQGEVLLSSFQAQGNDKNDKNRGSLQNFISSWKTNQCQERVELAQNAHRTLAQAGNERATQMYRNVVQQYIRNRAGALRNCDSKYTRETLQAIFDNVPAHNAHQAVCMTARILAQECSLRDIKVAPPKECDVCHIPRDMPAFTHDLNPSESITLSVAQQKKSTKTIYITYLFDESTALKNIQAELNTIFKNTESELRRRHPGTKIMYSVVGYGNLNKNVDLRYYTTPKGTYIFPFEYLEGTLKSLRLTRDIMQYPLDAVYAVATLMSAHTNTINIITLISTSKSKNNQHSPESVKDLLVKNGVTLYTLNPCPLTATKEEDIIGINKVAAFTPRDAKDNPVVGDPELRKRVKDCKDPLSVVSQGSHGAIFNQAYLRNKAPGKKGLLVVLPRLIAQNIKTTCQRCQCIRGANHVPHIACTPCDQKAFQRGFKDYYNQNKNRYYEDENRQQNYANYQSSFHQQQQYQNQNSFQNLLQQQQQQQLQQQQNYPNDYE